MNSDSKVIANIEEKIWQGSGTTQGLPENGVQIEGHEELIESDFNAVGTVAEELNSP